MFGSGGNRSVYPFYPSVCVKVISQLREKKKRKKKTLKKLRPMCTKMSSMLITSFRNDGPILGML